MDVSREMRSVVSANRNREARNYLLQLTLVGLFSLLLLGTSCGGSLPDSSNSSGISSANTSTSKIQIIGSTALLPLVAKAADLFHQHHTSVKFNVQGGGSVAGLNAVINHKADIGDSDIYADPAIYSDPNLTDHIVCVVPFALIVDPQITITSLTTEQISNIFVGKITNWKAVGGPDLAITTVIRPSTSGTRALFRKYILQGAEETGKPLTSDSSTTVLDTVAHTSGAIGYLTTTQLNSTVKAIAIDGVTASEQNIQAGKYKFWGYEHMYTLKNGIDATTNFLDFMQGQQVQALAQKMGYISVNALKAFALKS